MKKVVAQQKLPSGAVYDPNKRPEKPQAIDIAIATRWDLAGDLRFGIPVSHHMFRYLVDLCRLFIIILLVIIVDRGLRRIRRPSRRRAHSSTPSTFSRTS